MNALATTCRELGLTYVRTNEGNDTYDAEVAWWTPSMTSPKESPADSDGDIMVPLAHLTALLTGTADADLPQALRQMVAERASPPVPALTFADVPTATANAATLR